MSTTSCWKEYTVEIDSQRIDWASVHSWLASSYWNQGVSMERVRRASENSAMVIGAFQGAAQVGYMRVVSDRTRFAYLCDVWVDVSHRGKGLARAMVRAAVTNPEFSTVTTWLLATKDAHGVYASLGFTPLAFPSDWMHFKPPVCGPSCC